MALVMQGDQVSLANCGDSRVIVGDRQKPNGPLLALDLTTDHTPLLPNEKARIEAAGGYVAKDDSESEARVWLNRDMTCGLAMSRSLGDLLFKPIGDHFMTTSLFHFFVYLFVSLLRQASLRLCLCL